MQNKNISKPQFIFCNSNNLSFAYEILGAPILDEFQFYGDWIK